MFTQCSPRLHVCRSVTHSLMSAGRTRPSEAVGSSRTVEEDASQGAPRAYCQTLPSKKSLSRELQAGNIPLSMQPVVQESLSMPRPRTVHQRTKWDCVSLQSHIQEQRHQTGSGGEGRGYVSRKRHQK